MLWYLDCLTRGLLESETELHELSAVCLCCPGFQHTGFLVTSTVMCFHHIQLPQCELSPSLASALLGLHFVGAELRLLQPGYIQVTSDMLGECVISSFLSRHSKDLKWRTSVTAWLQLSILLGKQRRVHPRGVRAGRPQRRGQSIIFYILFYYGLSHGSSYYTVGPCDLSILYVIVREGNGTPLQYSCLENPMDGGAW